MRYALPPTREERERQAREAEALRVDRWHRTFNAALPECMRQFGALAADPAGRTGPNGDALDLADEYATVMHGELEPDAQ